MAGRETPATRALREAGVAFELREYDHDPAAGSYALEAAGYVTGGIGPFGQRRPLPTLVDETVEILDTVWVSGGRRGLEIGLTPDDLVAQLGAEVLPIAR